MADPAITVRQNEKLARRDDLYRLPNTVESMSLDEVPNFSALLNLRPFEEMDTTRI